MSTRIYPFWKKASTRSHCPRKVSILLIQLVIQSWLQPIPFSLLIVCICNLPGYRLCLHQLQYCYTANTACSPDHLQILSLVSELLTKMWPPLICNCLINHTANIYHQFTIICGIDSQFGLKFRFVDKHDCPGNMIYNLSYFNLLNPIPTGHGQYQPIYEHHVTTAGRNRVKDPRMVIYFK